MCSYNHIRETAGLSNENKGGGGGYKDRRQRIEIQKNKWGLSEGEKGVGGPDGRKEVEKTRKTEESKEAEKKRNRQT